MNELETITLTKFSIINESATSQNSRGVLCTVEGEFMEFEKKNRNERWYDISIGESLILKNPYVMEMVQNKTLLGEAQHPKDRFETVTTEASHCITKLWMSADRKHLMGRADILDTPAGRVVKTLIDYGSTLGVSARASGKLIEGKRNGEKVFLIDEDSYNFKTFDIVLNPGFASARLDTINESATEASNAKVITKYINESVMSREDIYSLQKIFSTDTQICEAIKNKEAQLNMNNTEEKLKWFESKYNETLDILEDVKMQNDQLLNETITLRASLATERDNLYTTRGALNTEVRAKTKFENENKTLLESVEKQKTRIETCLGTIKSLNENVTELRNDVENLNEMCSRKDVALGKLRADIKRLDEGLTRNTPPVNGVKNTEHINENAQNIESAHERRLITQSGTGTELTSPTNLPIVESVVNKPVNAIAVGAVATEDASDASRLASILRNVRNS